MSVSFPTATNDQEPNRFSKVLQLQGNATQHSFASKPHSIQSQQAYNLTVRGKRY
jgi:hypothetical protein